MHTRTCSPGTEYVEALQREVGSILDALEPDRGRGLFFGSSATDPLKKPTQYKVSQSPCEVRDSDSDSVFTKHFTVFLCTHLLNFMNCIKGLHTSS